MTKRTSRTYGYTATSAIVRADTYNAESRARDLEEVPTQRVPVVYYLEFGNRIKIGTSKNLPARLQGLTYDRLLAIEPGSHALEHLRHVEFKHTRVNGEWFLDSEPLRQHIASLVKKYGDPRPAYVRWIQGHTP